MMIPSSKAVALREAIDSAKKMTTQRRTQFPKYAPYQHAAEQIEVIERFLLADVLPSVEDVAQIDIGLMAAKELEADDPEYALWLMKLNGRFEDLVGSTPA